MSKEHSGDNGNEFRNDKPSTVEEAIMTNAGQAFLLAAEVFCLSFFGIFLFWFADRLRGGSARKPPR